MALVDPNSMPPPAGPRQFGAMLDGVHLEFRIELGAKWHDTTFEWRDELPPGWEPLLELVRRLERLGYHRLRRPGAAPRGD